MTNAASSKVLSFDSPPVLGILSASSRAAVGCGIGMMVAGKFRRPVALHTTAIALLSLGLLANVPSVIEWVVRLVNGPQTARGSNKRLRSIRGDLDEKTPVEHELF